MDSTVLDEVYGFPCERGFVGVLSGEKMTITIDAWTLWPIHLGIFGFGAGLYELGQRKGLETAERLYATLLNRIVDRTISTLEGDENVEGK